MNLLRNRTSIVVAFFTKNEFIFLKYPRKNHFFWGIFVAVIFGEQKNNQRDRRKIFVILGLVFLFNFSSVAYTAAQSVNLPQCAFESVNSIQFADTLKVKEWIANLKAAQQNGTIQVLHIGDSHVQSGAITAATRAKLQKIYGNAGFGLLFPYAAARTYSPRGYKSRFIGEFEFSKSFQPYPKFPLGLSGATVKTVSPKSVLRILQLPVQPLNTQYKITLWVPNSDSLFATMVKVGGREYLMQKEVDSSHLNVARLQGIIPAMDTFQVAVRKTNVNQQYWMLYGMEIEVLNQPGLIYHGAGMGGARLESVLNSTVVEAQIQDLSPQIVIVDLGTNDFAPLMNYPDKLATQLQVLIAKIKGAAPNAMVVLVSPMDMYFHGKKVPHTFAYSQMLAATAKNMHCGLWDWYWIAGANKAALQWQQKKWLSGDGIHMTEPGYWVKGDLLADALLDLIHSGLMGDSLIEKNWLNYDSLWNLKYPNNRVSIQPRMADDNKQFTMVGVTKSVSNATVNASPKVSQKTIPKSSTKTKVESPFVNPKVAVTKVARSQIESPNSSSSPTVLKVLRHTVKPGETLQDLAFEYDVNPTDIKKWNKLSGNQLLPGKTLVIRKMIPVGPRTR